MADLIVRDLYVARDGRAILNGCSGEFPSGRRTVLWGTSGAGKSTLLSAIAGLISPRSGTITMGARVLFSDAEGIDLRPHERHVGVVFQDLALWPHLSALEQVHVVSRSSGGTRTEALRLLESVELGGLADRRPGRLSGGEQQRLAIARALAGRPTALLLDEPFSSVDKKTRLSLYRVLQLVSQELAGPTIYVTHNAEDAISLAQAVIVLDNGVLAPRAHPWEEENGGAPPDAL